MPKGNPNTQSTQASSLNRSSNQRQGTVKPDSRSIYWKYQIRHSQANPPLDPPPNAPTGPRAMPPQEQSNRAAQSSDRLQDRTSRPVTSVPIPTAPIFPQGHFHTVAPASQSAIQAIQAGIIPKFFRIENLPAPVQIRLEQLLEERRQRKREEVLRQRRAMRKQGVWAAPPSKSTLNPSSQPFQSQATQSSPPGVAGPSGGASNTSSLLDQAEAASPPPVTYEAAPMGSDRPSSTSSPPDQIEAAGPLIVTTTAAPLGSSGPSSPSNPPDQIEAASPSNESAPTMGSEVPSSTSSPTDQTAWTANAASISRAWKTTPHTFRLPIPRRMRNDSVTSTPRVAYLCAACPASRSLYPTGIWSPTCADLFWLD